MKKNIALFALLAVGLVIWVALNRRESSPAANKSTAVSNQKNPSKDTATAAASPRSTPNTTDDVDAIAEAAERAERLRDRQTRMERADREYNTPITFYGVVRDLDERSVADATVSYTSVEGSFAGTRQIQSSADGRFTISGVRGKYLDVQVVHPDYYELQDSRRSFNYAGTENGSLHIPDPAKPEIFRLRKKGETAELIHQEDRVLFNKDESSRSFSFYDHTRRRDQPEYIILQGVETAERDKQGKPIRRLEMVVPEGGIQQRTDPFAFTASSDGYQPKMYFMRPEFGGKLDYFVKFNNGNYARFTIIGSAGDYLIDSYFNPDQSPNLEYDPDKQITVVRNGRMGVDLVYPAKDDPPKKQ